jgi:hypothetical protein
VAKLEYQLRLLANGGTVRVKGRKKLFSHKKYDWSKDGYAFLFYCSLLFVNINRLDRHMSCISFNHLFYNLKKNAMPYWISIKSYHK